MPGGASRAKIRPRIGPLLLILLLQDGAGLKIAQLTIANLNARRPSVTLGMSAYDDRQWQLCRCLSKGVEAKSEQWLQRSPGERRWELKRLAKLEGRQVSCIPPGGTT
jgi:hypothetical protein